jgi:hypothetical protein
MKIGITLNEVVRAYLEQFHHTYQKYKGYVEFEVEDVKSFDLLKYYDFKDKEELNLFLYKNCSLEVFGHADQTEKNIFVKLNNLIMDIEDEGEHEIYIVSREHNASIPSTLFFLSKMLCKARNIKFVKGHDELWDGMDVLITADPDTIAEKPEGKIAFKINTPYNTEVNGDFDFDSPSEIIDIDAITKLIKIDV